jgi:hypothetical protein
MLENVNAAANTELHDAHKEIHALRSQSSSLEQNLTSTSMNLQAALSKHLQLTSLPGAPFYDHVTHTVMACPVIQSNGHIVPLKAVISQWFSTVAPDDGTIHRTYVCPIMRTPTTLASMATQDRIRHIAQHAGVDTSLPLVFSYCSDSGESVEFRFQDQLNIIARICAAQTMQISECVERIIVQDNAMTLEINATVAQATPTPPPSPLNSYLRTLASRTKCSLHRMVGSTSNASPRGLIHESNTTSRPLSPRAQMTAGTRWGATASTSNEGDQSRINDTIRE